MDLNDYFAWQKHISIPKYINIDISQIEPSS